MFEYRKANLEDLENIWNKDIERHPNDARWSKWKDEYIAYNKAGEAATFVVLKDGEPVGQVTLLFSQNCKPVKNKLKLCDNDKIANFNAFRIEKQFEGQGHISKLVKVAEKYAKDKGFEIITIGAEAKETRNLAIYLHLGFNEFAMHEFDEEENNELVLYFLKKL